MGEGRAEALVVEELDHEVKFVLPATAAGPARALLAGLCRREEPHPRSRVGTIYFDDRTLTSAGEKQASDYRKTKVRVRWYDGAGALHLEVKRRFGSRREKLRLPVAGDGDQLEAGGLAAAARLPVAATLAASGFFSGGESLFDLAPVIRLDYQRERFVDAASDCRLSLDTEIVAIERAPWYAAARAGRQPDGGLAVAIVECKGPARALPYALRALDTLGARRRSFSKYTACLEHGIF
jgi:hypothetical protein